MTNDKTTSAVGEVVQAAAHQFGGVVGPVEFDVYAAETAVAAEQMAWEEAYGHDEQ